MSWRVTQESVVCWLLGAVLPLQSGGWGERVWDFL